MKHLLLLQVLAFYLISFAACSIYKSDGKECLENPSKLGSICTTLFDPGSFEATAEDYCTQGEEPPAFLKENLKEYPLSKVEKGVGLKAYVKPLDDNRLWLGVYNQSPLSDHQEWCQFQFLNQTEFDSHSSKAVNLAFQYFQNK